MKKRILNFTAVVTVAVSMAITLISCGGPQQPDNTEEGPVASTVAHPEWSENANMYEVNVRQFTPEGTFNAFAEHLPRLKEMGVDILWFMPVTPIGEENRKGTLGSYYSVKDYTAINPEFGTMEDFKNLVETIHEMGMYVIIDWVANHTAWDHSWTETNPEFYYRDEQGNLTPPHDTDWSDVIQLDYTNRELWDAMVAEMTFWLEEVNIDGFRCDVAYMVPTDFWNYARSSLDSIKPVFMLAEADHPELMQQAFNAGYSWTSHHAMNSIARGDEDVSVLDKYFFEEKQGDYPVGAYKIHFIDNHDENSWAGTVDDRLGEGHEAFAVLIATVNGMPLLYNGQEAGLDKMLEFFEKDQIDWSDLEYEDFYQKLLSLKHSNRALWNGIEGGPMNRVKTSDDLKVFAFTRQNEDDKVFVITNLSDQPVSVELQSGEYAGTYMELFTDETLTIDENVTMELDAWGYKVYYQ